MSTIAVVYLNSSENSSFCIADQAFVFVLAWQWSDCYIGHDTRFSRAVVYISYHHKMRQYMVIFAMHLLSLSQERHKGGNAFHEWTGRRPGMVYVDSQMGILDDGKVGQFNDSHSKLQSTLCGDF